MTAMAQVIAVEFDGNTFKVIGWRPPAAPPSGGWPSVFAVYAGTGDVPPLAGSYAIDNGLLVFRARYPVAPGVRYRAAFHPPGMAPIVKMFDPLPRPITPSARVTHVYPSADVLPSNQLRLYIYFSAPMSRGEAEQRIQVLDSHNQTLRGVFLPGQELWDPNNTRLTMTFDPGRIKRDLTSNRVMGPPIADGSRYTLVIDRDWHDAYGTPLVEAFRKAFRGGPPIRRPPDPHSWRITLPLEGTGAPLVVDFDRSMNYTLLQRMLVVRGPGGHVVGATAVGRNETEWRFTPQAAWGAGGYQLVVDNALEDLAGNKIGQPFDIDTFKQVTEHLTTTTTSLPFEIRPAR
jgi:hypothetical protein